MKQTSKNARTPLRSTEASAPREAGAHYTPENLTERFTEEALRVWESRWGGFGGHALWERETRVIDPACGDGILLLGIADGIWTRLARTPKHRALRTLPEALLPRILRTLHGADLRRPAAEAAARALPGANICCLDTLTPGAVQADEALIVMNPPWVGRSKRQPDVTAAVKRITGSGAADLAVAFLRNFPTARQISAILPKACIEGDSRVAGLATMLREGWVIRSATSPAKWPGRASVMFVTVHLTRG